MTEAILFQILCTVGTLGICLLAAWCFAARNHYNLMEGQKKEEIVRWEEKHPGHDIPPKMLHDRKSYNDDWHWFQGCTTACGLGLIVFYAFMGAHYGVYPLWQDAYAAFALYHMMFDGWQNRLNKNDFWYTDGGGFISGLISSEKLNVILKVANCGIAALLYLIKLL